ncbi:Protein PIN-LIKES 3 [Glycine soja]|uniref:Protein PIN-LIKES 3 n=1 Tax=Glycine soja TaxID=3848 RepID=A0A445F7T2_GLYSO|nr:Protein PIN-LIKES 3 [Glycine soja]
MLKWNLTCTYHVMPAYVAGKIFCTASGKGSYIFPLLLLQASLRTLVDKLNLKVILSPATIGSILGLIVGVVPPFQKMFVGDNAPLSVVEDSASMLGDSSTPAMTLLLGANLLNGLKRSGMKFSLLVGIVVIRYIALPILGVVIVKGAIHFGIIHHDPLYQFVLMLQYALPPATSISTITQLFGARQTECSIVMLATYVCASFSLTLWSTLFMWLVL